MENQPKTSKYKRAPCESGGKCDATNLETDRTDCAVGDEHLKLTPLSKDVSLFPIVARRVVDLRGDR